MAATLLGHQARTAQLAEASVANRVAALERFVGEIRAADDAYRDWQQAAALAELSDQHLDLLARTAADEHGIAELEAMSQHARAIRLRPPRPARLTYATSSRREIKDSTRQRVFTSAASGDEPGSEPSAPGRLGQSSRERASGMAC
jgi:hypothetical protein